MEVRIPIVQTKTLQKSNPDEYKLYRAALEYDLTEPIVIENRQDLRSEHFWRDRVEPFHHQVTNLITFCRRLPVTLLADDVGLGKTISAGLIASELMARGRVAKILVVCPKLLIPQWQTELDTKFGITAIEGIGRELITAELPNETGAVITTYQSARIYFDQLAEAGFDMLVLDEAHKLRNLYGTNDPPEVAKRFRQALADRLFKYVLMLTATPIQNRLWDLYSLIDLLTVAKGHTNPFGSQSSFAYNFIADKRSDARKLKLDRRQDFRSIISSYLSRFRRTDAKLDFPDRKVQLHRVIPTLEEIELFRIIAEPIQNLNPLAQSSIAQALVSSPQALADQLDKMALNRTIPSSLAYEARKVVSRIGITAKLKGLEVLVEKLRIEQPDQWRMVIFTGRQVTQGIIERFLNERGITCGLINGNSGSRNQETIERFKKDIPEIHVIISTEAGSEGVNLQAANVIVNYDLPWNPMVVEQRIGRVQRLASKHASVCVFNIILQGTFEEHIVGRLMEKLQLATDAIGDVDGLLEAAGMGEEDAENFEEKIRKLVMSSLAGKDIEFATQLAEESINQAKIELEQAKETIDAALNGTNDLMNSDPQCPKLPPTDRSMSIRDFVISGLQSLGATVTSNLSGQTEYELDGKHETIYFEGEEFTNGTLYVPGAPAFERLINRLTTSAKHDVKDADLNLLSQGEEVAKKWVNSFKGTYITSDLKKIWRSFVGTALLRVRITVAHDSYERLVPVNCSLGEHRRDIGKLGLNSFENTINDLATAGLIPQQLAEKALRDQGVAEFCRFYQERLVQEVRAAGQDLRKKKKLEDDFTPRIEMMLVGLEGAIHRILETDISYTLQSEDQYISSLALVPSKGEIMIAPEMLQCSRTTMLIPAECLEKCAISGANVLKHLLIRSEISNRMALPEYIVTCGLTGKKILPDEAERSDITGQLVTSNFLKISALSGKHAEPEFFTQCEFTNSKILKTESAISQISGKNYRIDEELRSVVSGKTGHKQEFIFCAETNRPLLSTEAEKCELTGKIVKPNILERCEVSGSKVIPSELNKSSVTGKKALKKFFVSSDLSGARLLEEEAIKSVTGKYCVPIEAKLCMWSGRKCYPDDLRTCQITGLPIYFEYITNNGYVRLEVLSNLLNHILRKSDKSEHWPAITTHISETLQEKNIIIEGAELSPDNQSLAICLEIKTWGGFKLRYAGLLYSITDNKVIGRIAVGKRIQGNNEATGWVLEKYILN